MKKYQRLRTVQQGTKLLKVNSEQSLFGCAQLENSLVFFHLSNVKLKPTHLKVIEFEKHCFKVCGIISQTREGEFLIFSLGYLFFGEGGK